MGATTLAADAAPARRRAAAPGRALTLATGLCAALPVLAAAVRALHEGWVPLADRGIIATRAFDVFSSHSPLVGQYSFAGNVTGHLTYSLGPMLYWLLAPAAHLGASASFLITMTIVNVACIIGSVALARRRGGVWLMLATGVGIALVCRSLWANNFYDIWNPSAALFPLLLLIFTGWSVACGDFRLLPLAALLFSYCAQAEDAFVPASLAVAVVALGGLLLSLRRLRAEGSGRAPVRWALAAVGVLAVCWAPAVIDQVSRTGNLGLVLQAARDRRSPLGNTVGTRAVIRTVGLKPWWLTRPSSPWVRKFDVLRPAGGVATATTALILGWLLVAAALASRRRRRDVLAAVALALALCLAVGSLAAATPRTPPMLAATLGYTLWSASEIGMFVWLIAGWSAFTLLGADRRLGEPSLAAALAGLAVVLVAGAAVAGGGRHDEFRARFGPLARLNAALRAIPRGSTVLFNAQYDGVVTPLRPELTFALRRLGVRPLGQGTHLRLGNWYEPRSARYGTVLWLYDHGPSPLPQGRELAHVALPGGHTARIVVAPASAIASRAGWSRPRGLGGCAPGSGPLAAFPAQGPDVPTGPGALLWGSSGCGLSSAALRAAGGVGAVTKQRLPGWTGAGLTLTGASVARLAATAALRGSGSVVLAAAAGSPLARRAAVAGPGSPAASGRAYLGDVAVAAPTAHGTIAVLLERYGANGFGPAREVPAAGGPITALTVTLDYRGDILLAWEQDGQIRSALLRVSGRVEPVQRVGPSAPRPALRGLVSDNDRATVAWASAAGGGARTEVRLALSGSGSRFDGSSRLVASLPDAAARARAPGAVGLVRLSTENVLMAWTAAAGGRYVVRTDAAHFAGTRPASALGDGALEDLAAGPAGEALAVWGQGSGKAMSLWSARVSLGTHDELRHRAPEQIAPPGPNSAPAVAVSPEDDGAFAAWRSRGGVAVSWHAGAGGYQPRPLGSAIARAPAPTHRLRIAAAVAAIALACAALAALWLRRRRGA